MKKDRPLDSPPEPATPPPEPEGGHPLKVQPVSVADWKQQADQWESFSFFQTPQWLEAICEAFGEFENRSVVLSDTQGTRVLLPLVENRKAPGLFTWLSLPYGTFGGPIPEVSNRSHSWGLVRQYLKEKKFAAVNLTLPPHFDPPQWPQFHVHALTTQVLDLRPGFEKLHNDFSSNCRWSIRRAQRTSIEVVPLDAKTFYDPFMNLYEQSMQRWGIEKGFPPKLFRLLWDRPGVTFWGALHQGKLVAANLILTHRTHQYYWLAVMDHAAQQLRPNNLLLSHILEQSCQAGIETFDFGNSEGLIGVFNFKKSFGPKVIKYSQLYYAGPLVRGYHRIRSLLKGHSEEP